MFCSKKCFPYYPLRQHFLEVLSHFLAPFQPLILAPILLPIPEYLWKRKNIELELEGAFAPTPSSISFFFINFFFLLRAHMLAPGAVFSRIFFFNVPKTARRTRPRSSFVLTVFFFSSLFYHRGAKPPGDKKGGGDRRRANLISERRSLSLIKFATGRRASESKLSNDWGAKPPSHYLIWTF